MTGCCLPSAMPSGECWVVAGAAYHRAPPLCPRPAHAPRPRPLDHTPRLDSMKTCVCGACVNRCAHADTGPMRRAAGSMETHRGSSSMSANSPPRRRRRATCRMHSGYGRQVVMQNSWGESMHRTAQNSSNSFWQHNHCTVLCVTVFSLWSPLTLVYDSALHVAVYLRGRKPL